jgi:hypothetical protein
MWERFANPIKSISLAAEMLWPFQARSEYGERREKGDILAGDGTQDMQTKAVDFVKELVDN